jgi:hypothetical protein
MRKINVAFAALGFMIASGMVHAAQAQTSPLTNLVTARSNQNLVGVAVGNGKVAGQPIVDVQPANGRPAIGVGALSGRKDHFGKNASVSVLNDARLVGIDGKGGVRSPNSISIRNPAQQPVLAGATNAITPR